MSNTKVRFNLQPTRSFPAGPPLREEYSADLWFDKDCLRYGREWLDQYQCEGCKNRRCPQCGDLMS